MKDVMIDLETLGTDPDCPVLSIGAVVFDIKKKIVAKWNPFHVVLDVDSQISDGRKPSGSTIKWWMQQDSAAKIVFEGVRLSPVEALNNFILWVDINDLRAFNFWGNGSHFDISIMENLFKQYKIKCPWAFNKVMDLRTFKRFVGGGKPIINNGIKHNALDDAIAQAQYVIDNS